MDLTFLTMNLIFTYYMVDMTRHINNFFKSQNEYFPVRWIHGVIYFTLLSGYIQTILNLIWNMVTDDDDNTDIRWFYIIIYTSQFM